VAQSSIEWTEATWNPVTGCDKISPGCKYCYAEVMARRLEGMGQANYRNGFDLTLQPHMLERPLLWRKPQVIFVNSMSDLFHEGVPLDYIKRVFAVMEEADWHQFQVLTKRAERLVGTSAASHPLPSCSQDVFLATPLRGADYTALPVVLDG
jgi:protein gp37